MYDSSLDSLRISSSSALVFIAYIYIFHSAHRMKLLANRWIKITSKGQHLIPAINSAGTEMLLEQQLKQQSAAAYPTSIKDIGGAKGTSPMAGMYETPMHNYHLHNR